MGRNKAFNYDAALDQAMQMFWRDGYEACSVKAISENLGITRSSFYNSFESRENLFIEVLKRYFASAPDTALATIGAGDNILLEICRTFRLVCEVRAADSERRGCLAINSVAELCGKEDRLSAFLGEAVAAGESRFALLLDTARRDQGFQCADVHATALALQALLVGINVLSKVNHTVDELWNCAKASLTAHGIYRPEFEL